ncbi:MAG: 4-hydroxybenzoate octaprenyltransferase [Hyphomicrobiales bacterium]|nr:4-hydroxybenzoate octaprenyltransferase [Hyphomicrobiales bacterium]
MNTIKKKALNYISITRLDKPTGWILLFIPCIYGIFAASIHTNQKLNPNIIILFLIGAILMRSVGCIFNDIIDRKIDAKVERTKNRPLANKTMAIYEAIALLTILLFISFLILLSFNLLTIYLGISSILLIMLYPFMKRITYWPQLFLGFTFNWGVIIGWTAITNSIDIEMILIYISSVFWTLGYDTVYGYQDINDDKKIGVKSTSILFEKNSKNIIWSFYGLNFLIMLISLSLIGLNLISIFVFLGAILFALYLVKKLDITDKNSCALFFSMNKYVGFLVCTSLLISI